MLHQIKAHEVKAHKIANLLPLMSTGKILNPDAGLTLVLDDGTKHSWVSEKSGTVPAAIGDYLVRDELLGIVYVVPAANFAALFTTEGEK